MKINFNTPKYKVLGQSNEDLIGKKATPVMKRRGVSTSIVSEILDHDSEHTTQI